MLEQSTWPEAEVIANQCGNDDLFLCFYRELRNRHMFGTTNVRAGVFFSGMRALKHDEHWRRQHFFHFSPASNPVNRRFESCLVGGFELVFCVKDFSRAPVSRELHVS